MLELFRRFKGPVMIGITIIIIVSFSWWGVRDRGDGMNAVRREPGEKAFTIFGRDYTGFDLSKIERSQMIAYYTGNFGHAMELSGAAEELKLRDAPSPYDFVGNLLTMREIAAENGVSVTDNDARARMETFQPFQKDGKFDVNTAAEFEERIKANGFSIKDVQQLAKDMITLEKLKDLIAGNYQPSSLAVDKAYALNHQSIKATAVTLLTEEFKKKAEVKDDEISKYYDETKDSYKTTEKRAAAYVLFEKPKPDAAKKAEENEAAQKAFITSVNEFDIAVKAPGADFNAVIADFQKKNPALKLQTLPAFEKATPPEAVKAEAGFVDTLFNPTSKLGQVPSHVEGATGYYYMKVTQIDEPKQQELKDVKDKVKDTLASKKATEAITKAADEARTALVDGLKAGKKIADLTKDKGWKIEELAAFSPNSPPPTPAVLAKVAKAVGNTAVNGVTKPEIDDQGATLVVVTHKELHKSDTAASLKTSEQTSQASAVKDALFKAWFGAQRKAAKLTLAFDPVAEMEARK
jgi:hypothetical protein